MHPSAPLFDRIFEANKRLVHAYLYSCLGNREEAEERLQDVFVKGWDRIHLLESLPEAERSRWLLAVARNLANDSHRRAAVRRRFVEVEQSTGSSVAADSVHDSAVKGCMNDWVGAAIECLPEELRTPLLMQVLGGLSSAQIGTLLEKPAGTIRYRVSEARKRLRAQLEHADLA